MAYRKIFPGIDNMPAVHYFVDRNENTGKDEIFIDATGTNSDNNKSVSEASDLTTIDSTLDWSDHNLAYSSTTDTTINTIDTIKNELNELAEKINSNEKKKKIKRIKISFSSK